MQQSLVSICVVGVLLLIPSGTVYGQRYVGKSASPDGDSVTAVRDGQTMTVSTVGDDCGRPYYLSGKFVAAPGTGGQRGTYNGKMYRCTTKELVRKCSLAETYNVDFTGNFTVNQGDGSIRIELTYPDQIWNASDCKLHKTKKGSDILILRNPPPDPPQQNTLGDIINKGIKGILYSPPNHPLNPANN